MMKDKKDIFDLFRENEHKLDERPDDKLWDRLEGRLDQSSTPRLSSRGPRWRQWMSMAGVVLALVVLISAINLLFQNNNNDNMHAEAKGVAIPLELEEIGIYSDKGPNYTVAEYQKILARLNTSPILEGDPTKELRIQKKVFASMNERSKKYIASVNEVLEKEKESFKSKVKIDKPATTFADANGKDQESDKHSSGDNSSPIASRMSTDEADVSDAKLVVVDGVAVNDMSTREEENKTEADDYGVESYDEVVITEEDNISSAPLLNAQINDVDVGAVKEQIGLQQFKWLLGKWEAPAAAQMQYANADASEMEQGKAAAKSKFSDAKKEASADLAVNKSIEEWKLMDEFTIEGQGYLVINGVTTFTENMQIRKIGDDLYYILALDKSGKTVQYKLKTYTEEGAVFENNEVAFPNQVILQNNIVESNFTTLLQNSAPAQINGTQQQYLQNRNMINSEQVKRVLNRVEER